MNNEKFEFQDAGNFNVVFDEEDNSKKIPNPIESADKYGSLAAKHIDKIIKAISFFVSLSILLIFLAISVILVLLDDFFIVIAAIIGVVGVILSLISLFLIYGLGHIISQNNEILCKLD